jgi:F-box protein 42
MRPSSKICPPKFLNTFLDSFRLTVICNRANLSARDGWKSSKVFNVVLDCFFPARYNVDFYSNITDVVNKHQMRFHSSLNENNIHWETLPSTQDLFTTISRRYSHAACYYGIGFLWTKENEYFNLSSIPYTDNYMYVFGGCTSTNTTFNDLWKLNLTTRSWVRPLPTGSYPSPKACATLVCYKDSLILYGGWTQSSSSPLHQVNLLKIFGKEKRWNFK